MQWRRWFSDVPSIPASLLLFPQTITVPCYPRNLQEDLHVKFNEALSEHSKFLPVEYLTFKHMINFQPLFQHHRFKHTGNFWFCLISQIKTNEKCPFIQTNENKILSTYLQLELTRKINKIIYQSQHVESQQKRQHPTPSADYCLGALSSERNQPFSISWLCDQLMLLPSCWKKYNLHKFMS